MERTRQTLTPTPPELPSSETERETVRRLADEQQLWTGLSGETLTGTEVADHLTTAREWLNEHGWDPHDRRTVGIALIRTAPGGEGDKDTSVAAGNLLGLLLQARANLNRWIDIEAWEAKHRRTWSEAATVDVIPDGPGQITSAKCTACPYSGWEVWTTDNGRYAETEARRLAQSHAERCRAMPRPEVA